MAPRACAWGLPLLIVFALQTPAVPALSIGLYVAWLFQSHPRCCRSILHRLQIWSVNRQPIDLLPLDVDRDALASLRVGALAYELNKPICLSCVLLLQAAVLADVGAG